MQMFTLTELANKCGEVAEAAYRGPVGITRRGRRKLVLIAADHYEKLLDGDARKAVHVEDLSAAEAADYVRGLEAASAALERVGR